MNAGPFEDGCLHRRNGRLYMEEVALADVAHECGTPAYVYSRAAVERNWRRFDAAFGEQPHLVCYAVKACSNIAVLNLLARLGSGFDIVSGGELARVLKAGGDPAGVVFSGVGKQRREIEQALDAGIACFNVESADELRLVAKLAGERGTTAPVALRVNPDVDVHTHPYIATGLRDSKFGIAVSEAPPLYAEIGDNPALEARGIGFHIGSQIMMPDPYVQALESVLALADDLHRQGFALDHVDVGGGFGIAYSERRPPPLEEYIETIVRACGGRSYRIIAEPGRAITGGAGVLLTELLYLKQAESRNFAVVDAAMNDLLRPALYRAWHDVVPVAERGAGGRTLDVVGPVCESGDVLAQARLLNLEAGDLLAVLSAGAYGFSMSGNYNSRPRAVEVIVDGGQFHVVRLRESMYDLLDGECLLE